MHRTGQSEMSGLASGAPLGRTRPPEVVVPQTPHELDAASGRQLWQTNELTESRSGASIHLTASGDRVFLWRIDFSGALGGRFGQSAPASSYSPNRWREVQEPLRRGCRRSYKEFRKAEVTLWALQAGSLSLGCRRADGGHFAFLAVGDGFSQGGLDRGLEDQRWTQVSGSSF